MWNYNFMGVRFNPGEQWNYDCCILLLYTNHTASCDPRLHRALRTHACAAARVLPRAPPPLALPRLRG